MHKIYLDNASTSFPKPPSVAKEVYNFLAHNAVNINRGSYNNAYSVEEIVFETRELLKDLFHATDSKNVVFTKNITESLNILLKGFLKPNDHVIISSMEHNAIMRPLTQLTKQNISYTQVPCHIDGTFSLAKLSDCLQENTKLIIVTHASNVCGTILPIEQIGEFCIKHNLKFMVDCAQTAGILPIDMQKMHIDALAFTGHKGLGTFPTGTIRFSFGYFNTLKEIALTIEALTKLILNKDMQNI